MVTRGDKIVFAIILVVAVAAVFFLKAKRSAHATAEPVMQQKSKKKNEKTDEPSSGAVNIVSKWEMPKDLTEISGISLIDDNRLACVQDEDGKIFIYDIAAKKVAREIDFGGPGDYEGIAVVGSTAWVQRADGTLFEVSNYESSKPAVRQHRTHLTAKQDVEGLCYDPKNNRLLLSIKGKEEDSKDYKGIYAFDLATKKLAQSPVYKIDLTDKQLAGKKGKGKVEPSDLAIDPATGALHILDGPSSKLLIMDGDGALKNLLTLNNSDFPQPEGIDFSPAGDMFISNEGRTGTGNILKVSIGPTP